MKIVTVRDFRDRATEMLRADDLVFITRNGLPAGFFVPWDVPELPDEVRKAVFARLTALVAEDRRSKGVDEQEVLRDFAASRRRR
jgi:hypothetical protein